MLYVFGAVEENMSLKDSIVKNKIMESKSNLKVAYFLFNISQMTAFNLQA